jgi:HlyD family secretion protein
VLLARVLRLYGDGMRRLFKRAAIVALVAVAGYASWAGWQRWRASAEASQQVSEIPTAAATTRDVVVGVSATGLLQPVRIVQVKSKAAGEIIDMPADLGDHIERGALVAQIDTETLTQELQQAEADLASAETQFAVAEKQFARAQELFERQLISRSDLEASEQNFASARAQRLRNQADVNLRQERLDDATVRAPISGTVIAKDVEEGQIIQSSVNNVSGGTTLVQMADLSELEIRTLVDEIDIGQVRPGMPVESTVEAFPERRFEGNVIKIEPQAVVQNQVTTFPVLSRIVNRDELLLPGMNADVDIVVHRRSDVLTVPNEAVRKPSDAAVVADLLGLDMHADGDEEAVGAVSTRLGGPGRESGVRGRGARADEDDKPGGLGAFGAGSAAEPAVVFLLVERQGPNGEVGMEYETRSVLAGVRDWEHTEIVSGLEEGDRVVLLPSTSLLQSQEELRQRFARRSGIPGIGR